MARTAAVVGTATATRNAVNRRQAEKNAVAYNNAMNTAAAQSAPQQVYAPPPQAYVAAAPAAPVAQEDPISQLERLGALLQQGLITEEEFAAQKAKILGM
jgi:hypothetical protein